MMLSVVRTTASKARTNIARPLFHRKKNIWVAGHPSAGGELLHEEPGACGEDGRLEQHHQDLPGQAGGHAGGGQDAPAG